MPSVNMTPFHELVPFRTRTRSQKECLNALHQGEGGAGCGRRGGRVTALRQVLRVVVVCSGVRVHVQRRHALQQNKRKQAGAGVAVTPAQLQCVASTSPRCAAVCDGAEQQRSGACVCMQSTRAHAGRWRGGARERFRGLSRQQLRVVAPWVVLPWELYVDDGGDLVALLDIAPHRERVVRRRQQHLRIMAMGCAHGWRRRTACAYARAAPSPHPSCAAQTCPSPRTASEVAIGGRPGTAASSAPPCAARVG